MQTRSNRLCIPGTLLPISWRNWLTTLSCVLALHGRGGVEEIPSDWQPTQRQRLEIASAEASGSLGAQYAPGRIHDGDRHTKWVCPTKPSEAAPQWISLTLAGGTEEVSSVAVFGEAINNDGILDANVQVEANGQFKTVASIKNARSASWRADFEPVRTGKVRLWITRSGGPTDHTDVWEVEVYRRPFTEEEAQARFAERVRLLPDKIQAAVNAVQTLGSKPEDCPPVLQQAIAQLKSTGPALEQKLQGWPALDKKSRNQAMQEAQNALAMAERTKKRAEFSTTANQSSRVGLEEGRKELATLAQRATKQGAVVTDSASGRTTLANERLLVSVDGRNGDWSAVWAPGVEVALQGIKFSVEVSGKIMTETQPTTTLRAFKDGLGQGQELLQIWRTNELRIEREMRVYDGLGVMTVGGRIVNESSQPVKLGTARLMHSDNEGSWWLGRAWETPAAIYIANHSQLQSVPFEATSDLAAEAEHVYQSSGILALAGRQPSAALIFGYVQAGEASPDLSARFRLNHGGAALSAQSRFLGRELGPNETVQLNRLYIAAADQPFQALEAYGDAMSKFSVCPVRTGPTGLWCSWYAHRMGMTEEKVLANAEVASRHFKPLGLEIMQLDHGWQRGDVTGDWIPNERFPHGLGWLTQQLKERYKLRLGVWIAPTDVAETSQLFQKHPELALKGDDGKARVNWRWYWKPNPNCYELDVTQPAGYQTVVDTFRQLTSWGVSYYKIDFIASSGGEQFIQHDPKATRGWTNLRLAMEAIRTGAGESAWIRYCQTPPILSAGLANSAYGGGDTLDAGIPGRFDVLLENAHSLAAGYWLNDRPYHREVCDMSIRMQGSLEEVRVRAAMMTLANCSISWSDEFSYLPPSRIRLMQQCMPPGNPPMKPLDLFDRGLPSIWHIKVRNTAEEWDVVGLFNFTTNAETRSVRFSDLGLDGRHEYAVFEFWEENFKGMFKDRVDIVLLPQSSRILSIRKVTGLPQLIGTDMHLLQGYHEVKEISWNEKRSTLTGRYHRMPGISGKAFFYVPEGYSPKFEFPLSPASARLTHVTDKVWMQELEFTAPEFEWSIPFEAPKKPEPKEPN